MQNQTFSIILAVFQFLTGVALALIMQRFGRLEDRVDKVDSLVYERSRELSMLAEGQRSSNIMIGEIKHLQNEIRKEFREELADLSKDIKEATRVAVNLVRYGNSDKG